MADDLLAIGAFSRASSISVRTLRNYHESGLLVPASIDPMTGYRSYTLDQLADALIIVRLRDLDLPLAAVHLVLTARDPELTRVILAEHETTMRARLEETERIVATLQHGLPGTATPVHLLTTPAAHAVQCRATVPTAGLWGWLERTIAELIAVAGEHRLTALPVGALYTAALLDDEFEAVTAFVAIDHPFLLAATGSAFSIGEIRATTWATLTHADGFATVGETYRLLGAWVARNAAPDPDAHICEHYPNLTTTSSRTDSTIEIRWPLTASARSAPR